MALAVPKTGYNMIPYANCLLMSSNNNLGKLIIPTKSTPCVNDNKQMRYLHFGRFHYSTIEHACKSYKVLLPEIIVRDSTVTVPAFIATSIVLC